MGRPPSGERKKMVSVTLNPDDWTKFQALVKAKCPEESASSHVGKLVIQENATLEGKEAQFSVNAAILDARLAKLAAQVQAMKQIIEKGQASKRMTKLMSDYGLREDFSNANEVLSKMLEDTGVKGTPVHDFRAEGAQAKIEFQFVRMWIEKNSEMSKVDQQLLEAKKDFYLKKAPGGG